MDNIIVSNLQFVVDGVLIIANLIKTKISHQNQTNNWIGLVNYSWLVSIFHFISSSITPSFQELMYPLIFFDSLSTSVVHSITSSAKISSKENWVLDQTPFFVQSKILKAYQKVFTMDMIGVLSFVKSLFVALLLLDKMVRNLYLNVFRYFEYFSLFL